MGNNGPMSRTEVGDGAPGDPADERWAASRAAGLAAFRRYQAKDADAHVLAAVGPGPGR